MLEDRTFTEMADLSRGEVYFYKRLKNLRPTGFFQSETIGGEVLAYDTVRGQYFGMYFIGGK